MKKEKSDIICIFVPYGVEPTSRQKNLPYKWEEEDGTFYSVMPREVYNDYLELEEENKKLKKERDLYKARDEELNENCFGLAKENENLKSDLMEDMKEITKLEKENKNLKERIDVLYEFIERNDKLVDEVIDEEDLDKLNRYIYIDDDLVDRTLESED